MFLIPPLKQGLHHWGVRVWHPLPSRANSGNYLTHFSFSQYKPSHHRLVMIKYFQLLQIDLVKCALARTDPAPSLKLLNLFPRLPYFCCVLWVLNFTAAAVQSFTLLLLQKGLSSYQRIEYCCLSVLQSLISNIISLQITTWEANISKDGST